jgi:DNA polymerase-3 subunit epsilon
MSSASSGTPDGAGDADRRAAWEGLARVLTASGHYRVLRRFEPRARYAAPDGVPTRTALFVDVETTGLDTAADRVIEFAAVPFTYDPRTGRVYEVHPAYVALEDPGRAIPPAVSRLTGITDAMVAGRRIDEARVAAILAGASLVVAHNAAFDRKFCERRVPAFAGAPWACSHAEVPWGAYGCRGTKLDYLLIERCGEFFDGHRAADDCHAAIHVLATPFPCGTAPLRLLLDAARTATVRVWAPNTPYGLKVALHARRYRWHPGDAHRPKAWYRDGSAADAEAECVWLAAEAYGGEPGWTLERLTARERYSVRA